MSERSKTHRVLYLCVPSRRITASLMCLLAGVLGGCVWSPDITCVNKSETPVWVRIEPPGPRPYSFYLFADTRTAYSFRLNAGESWDKGSAPESQRRKTKGLPFALIAEYQRIDPDSPSLIPKHRFRIDATTRYSIEFMPAEDGDVALVVHGTADGRPVRVYPDSNPK